MALLQWLFGRTPKQIDDVPDFNIQVGDIVLNRDTLDPESYREIKRRLAENGSVEFTITLPNKDVGTEPAPLSERRIGARAAKMAVEPVFCTIDYIDAAGNHSRRRITTHAVRAQDGHVMLTATCHERKAMRTFRLDRISRVVTFDGEIFSADIFARDMLGIDLEALATQGTDQSAAAKPKPVNFSRYTSPAIMILVATARADEHLHPEEAEVIIRYAEDEAFALEREGVISAIPDLTVIDKIARRIHRLRPEQEDLVEAFRALRGREQPELDRLKAAVAHVIDADGVIRLSEEQFLADVDRLFSASDTTAWAELDRLVAER